MLEPEISAGYENEGNVYLQQGKYKESVPYFQKALQIEPYFSIYSNLGTAYFFLKQFSDSAAMFEKAVAKDPNNAEVEVNLADAYRGRRASQIKPVMRTKKPFPSDIRNCKPTRRDAQVMADLALAFAKIANAPEADAMIQRARAIDKNNVNYIYEAAQVDALTGRSDGALKVLQEAFEKHYPAQYAAGDADLESLQSNPQFTDLVKKYSSNAH